MGDLKEICVQVKNDYLPNNPLLVAVDEQDRVIGFMGMRGQEIDSLFVDPKLRGYGLGRAFAEAAVAKSPCLVVSVNAQNRQAVAFYEAVGFAIYASSPADDDGRPYPLVRIRRRQ
jgi:putative acetyltransferase